LGDQSNVSLIAFRARGLSADRIASTKASRRASTFSTNAKTTTRLASAFGGVRRRGPPGTGVNLSQNRQRGRITAVGFAWDGSTANS
jgi:hypothetical protein